MSAQAGEVAGVFDGITELQKDLLDFIVNLLHYKKGYGIEQASIYSNHRIARPQAGPTTQSSTFDYIFSKIGDWQGVRYFAPIYFAP